jgi:uncharacterized protein (TIGR03435 family)
MMIPYRVISRLLFVVLLVLCRVSLAQTPAATPKFELSDVHPSPHVTFPFMDGGNLHGDRYVLRQASVAEMIASAYKTDVTNVQGGPSWLEMQRFDIQAKAAPGTSEDNLKLMLKSLLADRFHLVVHNGTAPMPAFILAAGKDKTKMKPGSSPGDPPSCEGQPPPPNQPPGAIPTIVVFCRNMTMERFADELHDMAGGYLTVPVINSTGLDGAWDFDLKWTPRGALDRAGADGISIFDAVDHELGLSLTRQTAPRPVLIVDSVDESPTPNPAEIEKILPPLPPAQFEVAVIRPAKPDEQLSGRIRGGQIDVHGISLRFAINFAWDLNPNDNQLIVNTPPWIDSDRFDILAKISSDPDAQANRPPDLDNEELRQMLQGLLIERFKMKVHTEDRPINTYSLMSLTPKMTKADPTSRTHCIEGPGPDGKDTRLVTPVLNRLVTCQNITMPQLADQFRMIAGGYIYGSILDETGLKGGWNFTLSFSSVDRVRGADGPPGASPGGAPEADTSDPNGALSLFDAVKREIGLKLEKVRRPVPVLVIDHVDEHPTEN